MAASQREVLARDSSEESFNSKSFDNDDEMPFFIRNRRLFSWLLLGMYFVVGVAVLMLDQGWKASTAIYVVVQVVTTVGYGDVTIQNGSMLFMSLYVLTGTVLVANILNHLLENLLEDADKSLDQSLKLAQKRVAGNGHQKGSRPRWCRTAECELLNAVLVYAFFVFSWATFFALYEGCSCSFGATAIEGCEVEMCSETGGKVLGFGAAVYMAIITFSTVGFGDYTPESELGRVLASFWIIFGVLSFGNLVAAVSTLLQRVKKSHQKKTKVSRQLFNKMDRDGSGAINHHEFLRYVLVREGKVTVELLDQIDHLFACLDVDSNGTLTYEEVGGRLIEVDEDAMTEGSETE